MKANPAKSELYRPFDINALSSKQPVHEVEIEAKPAERVALAKRFGFPAIESLKASISVALDLNGGLIEVSGTIYVDFEQICIISGDVFATQTSMPFSNDFVRAAAKHKWAKDDDEPSDFDVLDSDVIDLGEVVAQYFYLSLDPYPKKPGVESGLEEASDKERPFAKILQFMKKD